jgi:PhnB protein
MEMLKKHSLFTNQFLAEISQRSFVSKTYQAPEFPVAENEANKIMHIALPIGKHNVLIANDVPEFMGRVNENENRSKISVSAESREEADKIFNGLSAGGDIEGPIGDSPWGTYAGMFRDKYGIEWIVEFDSKLITDKFKILNRTRPVKRLIKWYISQRHC